MSTSTDRFKIDADISRAWSLPAPFYRDPDVALFEKERIFARTWQVIGHCNQIPNGGDYFTATLVDEPLLIVRTAKGQIRAFYNVCRHRAGTPAQGCGTRKFFRCNYHAWTYDLEGKLISAPEFKGMQEFHPEEFTLAPVRTEEWSGLIFVNLDASAEPLLKSLRELPQQVARFGFERMKLFERRTYDMKCNWKTYIDNYLEG